MSKGEGASIVIITNNSTVESVMCIARSKSTAIMTLLRTLFWLSIEFNLVFNSVYIPSRANILTEAWSRLGRKASVM